MRSGQKWSFKPKGSRFEVRLIVQREFGYRYDGEDEDGETQRQLDDGELVAFTSAVEVLLDDEVIGSNWLSGSVYADGEESQFWTAHRCEDPDNRNTLAMKARNTVICHYFPGMVKEAIAEARDYIRNMPAVPYVRENA